MSQFLSDLFTDTDSTNITSHTPNLGTGWSYKYNPVPNNGIITSNRLRFDGGTVLVTAGTPTDANYVVTGKVDYLGTGISRVWIAGRCNTAATEFYGIELDENVPKIALRVATSGSTFTDLGTPDTTYTPTASDQVEAELTMNGTTISARYRVNGGSWVSLGSVTNNTFSAAGQPGVYCRTNPGTTTGWHVTEISAATIDPPSPANIFTTRVLTIRDDEELNRFEFWPARASDTAVIPNTATLSTTTFAPTSNVNTIVIPSTASLISTGYAPSSVESVIDLFNRADASTLGSNWTVQVTAFGARIVSNQAAGDGGGAAWVFWNGVGTFTDDQYSQATIASFTAAQEAAAGVRQSGSGVGLANVTGYFFGATRNAGSADDRLKIFKVIAGTVTLVAEVGSSTPALTSGDVLRLDVTRSGSVNTLTGYLNGSAVTGLIGVTDSSIGTGGKPGFVVPETGRADNWSGGPVTMTSGGTTVIPSTASITTSTFAPLAKLGTVIVPSTTTLTTSTFAPKANLAVIPSTATLTTSTFASVLGLAVIPSTASLTTTKFAPVISTAIIPSTTALATSTLAPSIVFGTLVVPGTLSLTTTKFAPSIVLGTVVVPSTLSVTLSRFAPTAAISNNISVVPSTTALATSSFAPTINIGTNVVPSTLAVTTATFVPVIKLAIIPSTQSLTLSTFAPVLKTSVIPATVSLSTSGFAPTINIGTNVVPSTNSVTLTTFAPTIQTPVTVIPSTVSLSTVKFAPTINVGTNIIPATTSVILNQLPPSAVVGTILVPNTASLSTVKFAPVLSTVVVPTTLALTTTKFAPSILGNIAVIPSTANLTATLYAPIVNAANNFTVIPGTASLSTTTYIPVLTGSFPFVPFGVLRGTSSAISLNSGAVSINPVDSE